MVHPLQQAWTQRRLARGQASAAAKQQAASGSGMQSPAYAVAPRRSIKPDHRDTHEVAPQPLPAPPVANSAVLMADPEAAAAPGAKSMMAGRHDSGPPRLWSRDQQKSPQQPHLNEPRTRRQQQRPLHQLSAQPKQHHMEQSALVAQQQSAAAAAAAARRRRRRGPGADLLRAAVPPGLWVLPVEYSSEPESPAPPPAAPTDAQELLQVLQRMPPPRRRLVIFKGGGYVYAELEAAIESWGLGHVLRLTNLMRKAACVIARPAWDNGRRVNVKEHAAGAAKRGLPFLLLLRPDPLELVVLLRPLLLRKRIVVEPRLVDNNRDCNNSSSSAVEPC